MVSPALEWAAVSLPAACGDDAGFQLSCHSAVATKTPAKTPAKTLASSFSPKKKAEPSHDIERRAGRYNGSAS